MVLIDVERVPDCIVDREPEQYTIEQLKRDNLLKRVRGCIDLIHKWRPIYNSFVEVQISLPSLDTIQ